MLSTITSTMDGCKHPTNESYVMKMKKGNDLTSFIPTTKLRSLDHYLLDGDVFNLANKHWNHQLHDGTFFDTPGLLEQFCDLSVRSRSEVRRMFEGFLHDDMVAICEEIEQNEKAADLMETIQCDATNY